MQPHYPGYRPPRLVDPRLASRNRYGQFPQGYDLSTLQQPPVLPPTIIPPIINPVENYEQPIYSHSDVQSRSLNPPPPLSSYSIPLDTSTSNNQWLNNDAFAFNLNMNPPVVDPIRTRLANFAQRSREMIENQKKFIHKEMRQLVSEKKEEEICACMPPIETFTGVSKVSRRKHFYESLLKGDILCVEVTVHSDNCLICTVLCMDGGKRRDIHDCEIKVYCPSANCLIPTGSNSEDDYQPKDMIRVVVVSYNDYDLKIMVSMKEEHLPKELRGHFKMGPISDEDLPIHFRRQIAIKDVDYDEMLRATLAFNNPGASSYLAQFFELPISQRFSFLMDFHNVTYPEDEYFKHLRKVQSAENARQSVEEGVKFLKLGSYLEALQCLNKALQVDCDNLDALVARGCLYANTNSLTKAADDFDKALSIDTEHANARKYLCETLLAMGKMYEEKGDLDNAIRNYRRSCQVNTKSNEALEALKLVIERRGPQRSRSSQDELKNMYRDIKEKSYYETSHKLTLLLEEDKKRGRQIQRNRSKSSSSSSSSSSTDSSRSSSDSSPNSSSSSNLSKRRSRKKKSKKSKSKKSKKRKEKKKRRGSRDSIKSIPGIKIQKSKDSSRDRKTNNIVSRNTPKKLSPKISFTIKKIEPEVKTIKPAKPFVTKSSPKRNPTTEKIVYDLDKLRPVSIEFVRNGPADKSNDNKSTRKFPPIRPRSRSRSRVYIPVRSRSRSRSRARSQVRSRPRSRSRSRGRRRRSRSGPRAICRAIRNSPKRPRDRSRNRRSRSPRRTRRSSSRERSRRPSPSRSTDKTAIPISVENAVLKKEIEEAKKSNEATKIKVFTLD